MRSLRLLHTMKICIFINNVTFHLYETLHHIRLFMPVLSLIPLIFAICVAVAVLYAALFALVRSFNGKFCLFVQFLILLDRLFSSFFFASSEFHFFISQIHTRTFFLILFQLIRSKMMVVLFYRKNQGVAIYFGCC